MMGEIGGLIEKDCAVNEYIPPTMRENLQKTRAALMAKVERIDEALRLLDETPAYEKIHDAIVKAQVGGLR